MVGISPVHLVLGNGLLVSVLVHSVPHSFFVAYKAIPSSFIVEKLCSDVISNFIYVIHWCGPQLQHLNRNGLLVEVGQWKWTTLFYSLQRQHSFFLELKTVRGFSKGSSGTRDWTQFLGIAGRFFFIWANKRGW